MKLRMRECGDADLAGSAVVFAPHPDDETLGCGGTIARKRRQGERVQLVILTDGSSSHKRFISVEELRSIREDEAKEAAGVLGIEKDSVVFLRFVDQELEKTREEATAMVQGVLESGDFNQVFIPYFREPVADHSAANRIVIEALGRADREVTVYEYPVWFWKHWPWVSEGREESGGARCSLRRTCFQAPRMVMDFHCTVDITGVLDVKREAMSRYRSQMTRLRSGEDWPVLGDVAGGTFLECFLQEAEVFRRYRFQGVRRRGR